MNGKFLSEAIDDECYTILIAYAIKYNNIKDPSPFRG